MKKISYVSADFATIRTVASSPALAQDKADDEGGHGQAHDAQDMHHHHHHHHMKPMMDKKSNQ